MYRMLNCQAPDIKIIADRRDDIVLFSLLAKHVARIKGKLGVIDGTYHETPINPNPQPKTQKHKRNLAQPTTHLQDTPRPETQPGSQIIHHRINKRQEEDIKVRKRGLDEVGGDHLADRVRVYQPHEEEEGDEVVLQDRGLEVEVGRDEGPHGHCGE